MFRGIRFKEGWIGGLREEEKEPCFSQFSIIFQLVLLFLRIYLKKKKDFLYS